MRFAPRKLFVSPSLPPAPARYAVAFAAAAIGIAATAALRPLLGGHYFLLLLGAAVVSAVYGGLRAGLVTTAASVSAFILLFLLPAHAGEAVARESVARSVVFTAVATGFSWLGATLRRALADTERARIDLEATANAQRDGERALRGSTDRLELALEERRRSEAELADRVRLLDLANDAIAIRHVDGHILYWSRGAEALYGYTREEAVGRISHDLLQTEFPAPRDDIMAKLMNVGRWEGELLHVTRTGARITVASRWVSAPRELDAPPRVLESNTDVTPRKRAEHAQALLVEAGRLLAESLDPDETARTIAQLASTHLSDYGVLDATGGPNLRLRRLALFARDPDLQPWVEAALPPVPVLNADNPAARALQTGRPELLQLPPGAWEAIATTAEQRAAFEQLDVRYVAVLPLRARGRIVGLLSLGWTHRTTAPSPDDLPLFTAIADRAAIALANAQLYDQLLASERRLQDIIDNSAAVIFLKDPEGRYVLVNRAFESVVGQPRDVAIGRTDTELLQGPAELAEALRRHDAEVLRTRSLSRVEETVTNSDGSRVFLTLKFPLLSATGDAYAVCGIATDITDLKRAQHHLRRNSERLQVLHAMDAAIIRGASSAELARTALDALIRLTPAHSANLLLIDGPARRLRRFGLGRETGSWVDEPCSVTSDGGAWPLDRHAFDVRDLSVGSDLLPYERSMLAAGGRYVWSVPLVSNAQGVGSVCLATATADALGGDDREIVQEVADQLVIAVEQARLREHLKGEAERLEEQVRQRTRELQAANDELEAFSYSVSHDLRAPLRSVNGFAQAIEDDPGNVLTDRSRRYFGKVRAASGRMAQLIDDLLQLSRTSRAVLTRTIVDVSEIAGDVVADLRSRDSGRDVEVFIQPGMIADADPRLLRIVLENLIGNAWKFTGTQPHPRIAVSASGGDEQRVFTVEDNGVGFDMAYADKLFGAFQRMHREEEFPGTGIGLATVQRIVHRHGGRVWADSQPGRGALFFFTLGERS